MLKVGRARTGLAWNHFALCPTICVPHLFTHPQSSYSHPFPIFVISDRIIRVSSWCTSLFTMEAAQAYPSIQTFYRREVPKPTENEPPTSSTIVPGDGFTEKELSDARDPLNRKWKPEQEYEELGIGDLVPGPKAVTFIGRVVNVSTIWGRSQKQPKAAGWHYLILKNNTAAISVSYPCELVPFVAADSIYRSNCTLLAKRMS